MSMTHEDYEPPLLETRSGKGRAFGGDRLTPGVNVDRIDVAAGLRELMACGYPTTEVERHYVIGYALQRWARGEEEQAQRGAIDRNFHGIDLTSWLRVLAAARVAGDAKATPQGAADHGR